jgi:hypothetical protein
VSPYFVLCCSCYAAGLAVAAINYYYGPVAAVNFLAMAGLFDES